MKLIVGLGNPGKKYELTRHNVGFLAVDYLIDKLHAQKVNSSFKGILYKASGYFLLKPQTFMNLSGESAVLVKNYYKIDNDDIIVIHDDIDLKLGALRFKKGGSNGGHNGLKSLDAHIDKDYWRIRIGIGRPEHKEDVVKYVLNNFSKEETKCIYSRFEDILKSVENINIAASKYTRKEC